MSGPARTPEEPEPAPEDAGPDRWIRPFFAESTLWPVTLVLLAHAVVFGAVLLLFAARDRRAWALVGLLAVAVASAEWWWRDLRGRHFGLASRTLVACWLLSGVVAWVAHTTGVA